MGNRDDDDREKRSWAEIDKMRDRGGSGRSRSRSEKNDSASDFLHNESRKQQYLKQVEKSLFGKKGSPDDKQARKDLLDAAGKKSFTRKAKAFWDESEEIEDWEVLMAMLDVTDPDLMEAVADRVAALYPDRSPAEQKTAVSKLRIVKMAGKDPDLIEIAGECLAKIDV